MTGFRRAGKRGRITGKMGSGGWGRRGEGESSIVRERTRKEV